ncbi:O-antigen polysaccharide polymerase Wzy [Candidatus Saccharibacteria bacterium]|nr:O-antigen polysaccharide polymerase Wzy [Candidatus Saccharibacteria bacterium]
MKAKRNIITAFIVVFSWAVAIVFYLFMLNKDFENSKVLIMILSVLGWVELIFCLLTMKNKTGKFFSIYSIFIIFAFLFTYGQCLLWALGVHSEMEIGQQSLYTFGKATDESIIRAQMVTLVGLLSFHLGVFWAYRGGRTGEKQEKQESEDGVIKAKRKSLLVAAWICNLIASPLAVYAIVRSIMINSAFGYGATLYNADVVSTQNNFLMLLCMMYIPSLFGILIGSRYDKKQMTYCYLSFAIYMALSIMAGDRGEWLFPLLILVWMHHSYHRPIRRRNFVLYLCAATMIAVLGVGIRNTRSFGVDIVELGEAISVEQNPIASAIFEMGGSMKPLVILTQYGWNNYPYGNSYFSAIVGMITEKPLVAMIPGYKGLSSWFSSEYLGINYGAGFSFIAEAYANCGPYLFMFAMIVIGILFSKFIFSNEEKNYVTNPIIAFATVSLANAMILSIRNTMLVSMKTAFYSILPILIIYYLICFRNRGRA